MTLNSNIFLFLRLMLLHLLILVNNLCVIVIITFFLKVELFFPSILYVVTYTHD